MNKLHYESPELDIRWFETEDICTVSGGITDTTPGDSMVNDDEWGTGGGWG